MQGAVFVLKEDSPLALEITRSYVLNEPLQVSIEGLKWEVRVVGWRLRDGVITFTTTESK